MNADKPLVFFNRQPSDTETGFIDQATMDFSAKTFYVGFDAFSGGNVQGQMITDYLLTKTKAELDLNSDGYLGYLLCIGDEEHNDSKARTIGIRNALHTLYNTSPAPDLKQEGSVTVKDGTLKVRELDAKVMVGDDGTAWNASKAKETMDGWASAYQKEIDLVISNNDGMALGCLNSPSYPQGVPLFGYDANADAVASIGQGKMTGTVSQNADGQAEAVLEVIRNLFDGLAPEDAIESGFSKADQYGNRITPAIEYLSASKALLALNAIVTKANWESYKSGTRDSGIKQLPASVKTLKVWYDIYNKDDDFLSSSYLPALQYYASLMNIGLYLNEGDGAKEESVLDKFVSLDKYDAYAVNMVKTDAGPSYTSKLK